MKSISPAMDAHLSGSVTTLATAWKITRQDGVIRGFTDHDKDVFIDGQTYFASSGYFRTAISNSAGTSVDNVDVRGFLDSNHIDETELRNGKYDYAHVQIFAFNWADISMGIIPLRFGLFGETVINSSGLFKVELRGLTQLYSQTIGDVYQPECRADLGDSKCKIQVTPPLRISNQKYEVGDRVLIRGTDYFSYKLPLVNADFETGDSTGWSFDSSVLEYYSEATPYEGSYMLYVSAIEGATRLRDQSFSLASIPLSQGQIDTGIFRIEAKTRIRVIELGVKAKIKIECFGTLSYGNFLGSIDSGFQKINRPGEWGLLTVAGSLPSGTVAIKIHLGVSNETYVAKLGALFDNVECRIFDPSGEFTENTSFLDFAGVEYECTSAGVTAETHPNSPTRVIGDTINDGSVTWQVVKPTYTFLDSINTVTDHKTFTLTDVDAVDDFFEWGVLEVLEGENQGRRVEVHSWVNATKQVVLKLPLTFVPVAGERVRIQAGCNKSREDCHQKFANIINFRGEPDLPGTDQYFKVGGANTQGEL